MTAKQFMDKHDASYLDLSNFMIFDEKARTLRVWIEHIKEDPEKIIRLDAFHTMVMSWFFSESDQQKECRFQKLWLDDLGPNETERRWQQFFDLTSRVVGAG